MKVFATIAATRNTETAGRIALAAPGTVGPGTPQASPSGGVFLWNCREIASAYEPPEKDREGKNVGMGTALCRQSAPHKA
jgi:hypothetical protein